MPVSLHEEASEYIYGISNIVASYDLVLFGKKPCRLNLFIYYYFFIPQELQPQV